MVAGMEKYTESKLPSCGCSYCMPDIKLITYDDNDDRWSGSEGGLHKCATRAVSAGGATSAQAGREGGEQLFINTIQ